MTLAIVIARVQRRARLCSMALGIAVAGAVFAAAIVVSSLTVAVIASAVAAVVMATRTTPSSRIAAARLIEARYGSLDNLLVTAIEIEERPRPVRAEIRAEIDRQASERIRAIDPRHVLPLAQSLSVATAVLIGCAVVGSFDAQSVKSRIDAVTGASTPSDLSPTVTVRVVPPAYSGKPAHEYINPLQVTALAGSEIAIAIEADVAGVKYSRRQTLVAKQSAGLELRARDGGMARFLSLIVVPDQAPSIRVVAPGKDTAFAEPAGRVAISIQAGDDLGVSALSLRFTKASGGGEAVSFTEGEVPLRIERRSEREWLGRAELSLDTLGLADGDILVYQAIARDSNPNGVPVPSDQYLIEIGKNAEIADAGFALPSEEKKYAISQQMVIYHTEQLLQRPGLRQGCGAAGAAGDACLEQSRDIAIEQRMVRAEVVFLGGGEVQDEVEEAAHSHELAEGRLENTGRAEMLRAINAMSRAEALLNDGSVKQALVLEREALAHLERALDRRRYFLRTLPDRSRIDATRRLIGDRRDARAWAREQRTVVAADSIEAQRQVMRELAAGGRVDAALAARLAAIDPSSVELQNAAVAVASAATDAARDAAAQSAMTALTAHAFKSLPASATVGLRLDPLAGRLAEEMKVRQ